MPVEPFERAGPALRVGMGIEAALGSLVLRTSPVLRPLGELRLRRRLRKLGRRVRTKVRRLALPQA